MGRFLLLILRGYCFNWPRLRANRGDTPYDMQALVPENFTLAALAGEGCQRCLASAWAIGQK